MSDWRDEVMKAIRKPERIAPSGRNRSNRFLMQAHVPPAFIYLLDKVTREMNYSQASWLRRAVAVQLASQNDIPLSEILSTTTQVRQRGKGGRSQPRYPDPGHDDMTEIGVFCPHPGCDGAHFR